MGLRVPFFEATTDEISKAYRQWDSRLRIVLGAISLVSLAHAWFDGGFGVFLDLLVKAYRDIFHTVFNAVFAWVQWVFPTLRVPLWIKDVAVFYSLIGGALVAAVTPAFDERLRATSVLRPVPGVTRVDRAIDHLIWMRRRLPGAVLKVLLALRVGLFWPQFARDFIKRVILVQIRSDALDCDRRSYDYYYHIVRENDLPNERSLSQRVRRGYNLNRVFVLQLVGVVALAVVLVLLSAGLEVVKNIP